MMEKIITSKRWSLKLRDFAKGLYMAVIVPALLVIQQSLEKGELSVNWELVGLTAAGAFVGYLIKNLTDAPKVVVVTKTNEDAEDLKKSIER